MIRDCVRRRKQKTVSGRMQNGYQPDSATVSLPTFTFYLLLQVEKANFQ